MTTRIKICGITRQADAEAVVAGGADALGLMFVAASPRRVDVPMAAAIADAVAGRLLRIGVFRDPQPQEVEQVCDAVALDALQFHGSEPGVFCRQFGLPYLKVHGVQGEVPLADLEAEYPDACCLLLDTRIAGVSGGTGERFDWRLWPAGRGAAGLPLALAGGLNPDNVGGAVTRLRPWGVDVSGGVEGAVKGHKDGERIRRFVAEVRSAGS